MGTATSTDRQHKQPMDIGEFRQLRGPVHHYVIPEVPEKRKVTDLKFTIAFAVAIGLLLPFLIYTFCNADLKRFSRGYDDCGNVCGVQNSLVSGIGCSGADMTSKPYTEVDLDSSVVYGKDTYHSSKCVKYCNTEVIFNRCFHGDGSSSRYSDSSDGSGVGRDESKIFSEIADGLNRSAGYIVSMCFFGLVFTAIITLLFRYFTAAVVWVILIGSIVAIFTILYCVASIKMPVEDPQRGKFLMYIAVFCAVMCVILLILVAVMFKRINQVIRLFKEAMKIIFHMPHILAEPLLTFVAYVILLVIFCFFVLLMDTAGSLEPVSTYMYVYIPNGVMIFTMWYHVVICVWMTQFIIGCQHMVIAGAVSAYYFARDKTAVQAPVYNSFYNLVRYHLGTVACGSLIITIIAIIRALIRSAIENKQAQVLVDSCLGVIADFLKYLSKNAYIQTAIHGQPFVKSGKRAVRLLYANAISAIVVNSVGDFVLAMAQLLIVALTCLMGYAISDKSIPYFGLGISIAAVVTFFVAASVFSVFETAVDTIFLCYCEDSCMNDGMTRPYYMTTGFRQYIEDAKDAEKKAAMTPCGFKPCFSFTR